MRRSLVVEVAETSLPIQSVRKFSTLFQRCSFPSEGLVASSTTKLRPLHGTHQLDLVAAVRQNADCLCRPASGEDQLHLGGVTAIPRTR